MNEREATPERRGRPPAIPTEARWLLRQCHQEHFGEWGPTILAAWAERSGIGSYSPSSIGRVIADLRPRREPRTEPRRYELAAPMVMWSIDGAGFRERGRKKELLLVQDERARMKVGRELAAGPAQADDVLCCLERAFEEHGAPLLLKHDGGSVFLEDEVQSLLDDWGVLDLTSPPHYPPYNGKKERNFRDVRSFERALRLHGVGGSLESRIAWAIHDIDVERPRPVLGGRTAAEVFEQDRVPLPSRRLVRMAVETRQLELEAEAGTRAERADARRRAVAQVLSALGLLVWKGGVSTVSRVDTATN